MTTDSTPVSGSVSTPPKPTGRPRMWPLVFFGVILPALALIVELLTQMCAGTFLDPIPTVFHIFLIAFVPLANLAVIVALRRNRVDHLRLLGWLNGVGIGIAGFYALLFLPFSPFAAIAVLFGGAGLLPLSPLSALITAIVLRRRMKRLAQESAGGFARFVPGLWPGIILALVALIALEIPKTITAIGLQMATAEKPALQARGLRLLRTTGKQDVLLGACYNYSRGTMGPFSLVVTGFGRNVTEEEARVIYYRVTGTPFNSVEPPKLIGLGNVRERARQLSIGETIQGRIVGLSLNESKLDTVIDAEGAATYTEWTMVFKNVHFSQHEASAIIMLPPGGVVSRLTLWIDGDEREAAFGGRSQVKEAYKKVVERRRDPVIVTTCGPDRVLVRCFPVPPNNGAMKIRLGITSPLDLDAPDRGLLRLPYFAENNFNLPETVEHGVWLESGGKMTAAGNVTGWVAEQISAKAFALRGTLKASALDNPLAVQVERPAVATECWAKDTRAPEPQIIRQTIQETSVPTPQRVVIVIDGSRSMGVYREALAAIIAAIPQNSEFGVLLASDDVVELMPLQAALAESLSRAAEKVKSATFNYGCDNVPALSRAWDMASGVTNSRILWLHATQPVNFGALEPLRQKLERRPDNPLLLCAQFGPGPNVVVQGLDKISAVRSILRSGDAAADVRYDLAMRAGTAKAIRIKRTDEKIAALPAGSSVSFHVVRLWALDEIRRLSASKQDEDRARALALARTYQLVTPVSGAVVLETQQQYNEAGLEPVSSQSVPTIPEPETWILLVTGVAVVLVVFYYRRRAVLSMVRRG